MASRITILCENTVGRLIGSGEHGFSAFIEPNGTVHDRTGVSEQRVIVRDIPQRGGRTLYSRLGDLPLITIVVAILLALIYSARKTRP